MRNNSAGSPDAARWSADIFLDGAGGTLAMDRFGAGAASGCCAFNQCNPTATLCAQIFPHCRESRQLQRFSMSTPSLMTIEARKESSPACTTPRSNGGSQNELST